MPKSEIRKAKFLFDEVSVYIANTFSLVDGKNIHQLLMVNKNLSNIQPAKLDKYNTRTYQKVLAGISVSFTLPRCVLQHKYTLK